MDLRVYEVDGIEYILINQVIENNIKYVFLSSKDGKKQLIQKIYLDKPDLMYMLDNKEEVAHALDLFRLKMNKDD